MCSAAQSFAMSLLERRPSCGTGIHPPSVHEVVRDSRLMRVWGGAQTRLGAHLL